MMNQFTRLKLVFALKIAQTSVHETNLMYGKFKDFIWYIYKLHLKILETCFTKRFTQSWSVTSYLRSEPLGNFSVLYVYLSVLVRGFAIHLFLSHTKKVPNYEITASQSKSTMQSK